MAADLVCATTEHFDSFASVHFSFKSNRLFARLYKSKFDKWPLEDSVVGVVLFWEYIENRLEVDCWIFTAPDQNFQEENLVHVKVLQNMAHYCVLGFLLLDKIWNLKSTACVALVVHECLWFVLGCVNSPGSPNVWFWLLKVHTIVLSGVLCKKIHRILLNNQSFAESTLCGGAIDKKLMKSWWQPSWKHKNYALLLGLVFETFWFVDGSDVHQSVIIQLINNNTLPPLQLPNNFRVN